MTARRVLEAAAAIGLLLAFLLVTVYWPKLPDAIPKHFDASGRPNAWGGRSTLYTLLILNVLIFLLMTIASHYADRGGLPFKTQEELARKAALVRILLAWLKAETTWTFAYIEWRTIQVALGRAETVGAAFYPLLITGAGATVAVFLFVAHLSRASPDGR